jgi:hypothetical protein
MDEPADESRDNLAYWTLVRDVAVLQVKLVVDGFRDLLLLPAALIAGVMSLVSGSSGRPGPQFYRLLALGKRSERWINLFGAIDNSPEAPAPDSGVAPPDIDDIVSRLESYVVDEYRRGGVTRQAKERIDKVLDTLGQKHRRR